MSNTVDNLLDEKKEEEKLLDLDLSFEHSQHDKPLANCYECSQEQVEGVNVDALNKRMDSNLSVLQARIKANKEAREALFQKAINPEEREREFTEVPEVTIEETGAFNLERHTQLCKKVEALYNNYIVSQRVSENKDETFDKAIKELSEAYDLLIWEGINTRF